MKKILFLFTIFIISNISFSNNNPNGYNKNENYVYYKNKIIKKADLKTFEILSLNYAKDTKHVYLKGRVLKNADPETFEIIKCPYQANIKMYDSYYAKDKYNYYYMNKLVKGYVWQCGI